VGGSFDEAQRDEWAKDYFQDIEQLLSPLAHSGVRIFLFNFEILQERVAADPGLYGFASATNCEAGPGSATTPNTVHVNFPGCFYDIPSSRHEPKILRRNDAKVICDRIA
jgi:phospholipase/lecithinase/hemolysin